MYLVQELRLGYRAGGVVDKYLRCITAFDVRSNHSVALFGPLLETHEVQKKTPLGVSICS